MSKELAEVIVAPRKAIHLNGNQWGNDPNAPSQLFGPGSKVLVEKREVERLYNLGFIVDPSGDKVSAADIAAADLSHYIGKDSELKISEKSDQKIIKGRG